MRTHYIYKVTNTVNGMSYIGQTYEMKYRRTLHERCRPEDDCYFHRALHKYGIDKFEWSIIDTANTKEEADRLEIKYIAEYNSLRPNGYNTMTGGQGGCLWNARAVVCLTLDGEYVTTYRSAGEAERIGGFCNASVLMCCKGRARMHNNHVFMFKDDYDANGPRIYRKPESTSMKPVIQCDMQGNFIAEYKSVVEASKQTGILRSRISSAITGASKTAGGYIFVYNDEFPVKDPDKHLANKKGKKVAQVDPKTGEIIQVFDRMADAGRALGVNYKGIQKVVDKPLRTAFGYKWISQ